MNSITTFSFQQSFLDELVGLIEENYLRKGRDLSRLALCFGGKRPALFLQRELARRLKKSFYPPRFFTIDDFVVYTVSLRESFRRAVDLDQCFLLYRLAQENAPEILKKRETFARFLPWAREITQFIDQLDLEFVRSEDLLHIEANAEIGYAVPEDVNRLLQSIVVLRGAYHQALRTQRVYPRGYLYQRCAEVTADAGFEEFDEIWFCNFFYLNRCEALILQNLYQRGRAKLIFQGDERRWPILKKTAQYFSSSIQEPVGQRPVGRNFQLQIYAGFDVHSQAGLAREILKKIPSLDKTLVVLPDANHAVPLASEIARITRDFNISMGYPLRRSSLYALCESIFQAQLSRKNDHYYARDYLRVLRHPFVKNFKVFPDPAVTRILVHKIEEILRGKERTSLSGSLFFALEDLERLEEAAQLTLAVTQRMNIPLTREALTAGLKEIHRIFFAQWSLVRNFRDFSDVLGNFLDVVVHKSILKNYPLNLNIAVRMYHLAEEFENVVFAEEQFSIEEIFKIFETKAAAEMAAFSGSPLKGLQILGLFETRSLSFENVIILDVNEGVLPRLNVYEPLIPREVMVSLNLDRLELEEEIQRYQFMRLTASAKNVHLIYQESRDKERSRFIEELIWEEQKSQKTLGVFPVIRAGFEVKAESSVRIIPKTPEIVDHLKKLSYSASSINTYLRDPVEFYYSYVLGLKEQEDLLDEPEAQQVGTFIHALLEDAFKPFLNRKPQLDGMFRERFWNLFDRHFDESLGRGQRSDAFLLKAVIKERLERFLENEASSPERQVERILYLENRFEETIPLSAGEIRFKYILDRIDELNDGTIMIVDYKTGGIDQMPKGLEQIQAMELSRELIFENVRSFQIPLYFLYLEKQFKDKSINAALYNLRTLELKKFIGEKNLNRREELKQAFLRALDFVVSEITDLNTPFIAQENPREED